MALTLNGSTGISGIAGSAGTPALQGNNDTNTGYFFATDTLGLSTAGSERLRITSDGKIGIGEDDPDGNYLLIRAASTVGTTKGHIMLTGDGATNGEGPQIVFSESGSGSNFAGAYIGHIRATTNSVGHLVFGTRESGGDTNTVPTEKLRITSDGKVGIGTTSPSQKLVSEASSGYAILANGSANGIALGTNGAIVFGTKNIAAYAKGIFDASEYEFKLSASVNTYLKTTGLGIGVNPTATLHVNGPAKIASREQYGGQIDIGASSNWWKIGTISNFGGGSAARITILGTNSYGADDNISGETSIILRRDNSTRVRGYFYGSGTTNSYLTIVAVATKATANSNEFDIWVKPGGHYANIATFVDLTSGTWTDAPSDTGSTSQPTSSNALQKDWVLKTGGVGRLKVTDSSGDLTIVDGDLALASGHGIDFSANANNAGSTSELLDDYEEGTFTPSIRTTGDTAQPGYTRREGIYTKIGDIVHVFIRIDTNANIASGSGATELHGLPFTGANWTTYDWPGNIPMSYYSGLRNGSSNTLLLLGPFRQSTYARFHFMNDNGDNSTQGYDRIFGSGTVVMMGGSYKAE